MLGRVLPKAECRFVGQSCRSPVPMKMSGYADNGHS